jgi:hypothetical protein
MGFPFLSDEWFEQVKKLRDEAGDLQIPDQIKDVKINVCVTSEKGNREICLKAGNFEHGFDDTAQTKVTLAADLARKIFVDNDKAAGMQAFMNGLIKLEGDPTKLMMMQGVPPTPTQLALLKKIQEITE